MIHIETVSYGGWARAVRLTNGRVEALVTQDVGPRILRFAFCGGANVFGEFPEQLGGVGEADWKIRGGHRLWVAPQEQRSTYEPDNGPVSIRRVPGGVQAMQDPGSVTGLRKTLGLVLSAERDEATVTHRLTNAGRRAVRLAPWALSVMAPRGEAVIPLPPKAAHGRWLLPTQVWSFWSYTDLSDPRWTIGPNYLRLRQNAKYPSTKLGLSHRAGWAAYCRAGLLFVKAFPFRDKAAYPDGGVNFEVYADPRILELESLGPLVDLKPGQSVSHVETWGLYQNVPACRSEADLDRHIRPVAAALTLNRG